MVSGMDLAVLGCKRTARRDRDGAKLDRLLITAVSGPIGEIAKCTKKKIMIIVICPKASVLPAPAAGPPPSSDG